MKKPLLFFLLIIALGIAYFNSSTWKGKSDKAVSQQVFPVTEHKPIVVVIPSYNNVKWCKKNLGSALKQDYDNFRIIYVDDASNDGMMERIKEYLLLKDKANRVTYIRNETNRGAVANLYAAVHNLENNEIVVVLDGDDWFAHDRVLKRVNEIYADPNVWLTYGNYIEYPTFKKSDKRAKPIPEKIVRENSFRDHELDAAHLRTFYAGLFKQIALHDFLLDGKFYESASGLAGMLPMLEMAGEHAKFVKDILLIYNHDNPLNDDKVRLEKLQELNGYIRSLPRYDRLALFPQEKQKKEKADLVVFSFDRPMQLYAFLESLHKHVTGLDQKIVIYRSSSDVYESGYEEVKNAFPSIRFVRQGENGKDDFRQLTMRSVFEPPSRYVVFAVDDIIVKDTVDIVECTAALEKTGAYGFYLKLGKTIDYCYTMDQYQGIPESISFGNDVFAWQFKIGKYDWKYPNTLDFTVYKKEDIRARLSKLNFHNPNTLEALWANKADMRKVGLYFENSKIINVPLNLVNVSENRCMNSYSAEELIYKFKAGLKMDISRFYQIANRSVHTEAEITFTQREHEQ